MGCLLLVVAANEGVMPQTREHLAILQYLNVAKTIVVVSKIDPGRRVCRSAGRAGGDRSELEGTIAQGTPPLGRGIRGNERGPAGVGATSSRRRCVRCPRPRSGPAVLRWIAFSRSRAGTIRNGTLDAQGTIANGAKRSRSIPRPVEFAAFARLRRARAQRRERGSRVALNLAGVGRDAARVASLPVRSSPPFDALRRPRSALRAESRRFSARPGCDAHRAAEIQGTLVLPRERLGSGP